MIDPNDFPSDSNDMDSVDTPVTQRKKTRKRSKNVPVTHEERKERALKKTRDLRTTLQQRMLAQQQRMCKVLFQDVHLATTRSVTTFLKVMKQVYKKRTGFNITICARDLPSPYVFCITFALTNDTRVVLHHSQGTTGLIQSDGTPFTKETWIQLLGIDIGKHYFLKDLFYDMMINFLKHMCLAQYDTLHAHGYNALPEKELIENAFVY